MLPKTPMAMLLLSAVAATPVSGAAAPHRPGTGSAPRAAPSPEEIRRTEPAPSPRPEGSSAPSGEPPSRAAPTPTGEPRRLPAGRPTALPKIPVETMTFDQVLGKAIRHNRELRQAGLDLASARQAVRAAKGSYDPQLRAGVSYQRSTAEPVESVNIQALKSSSLDYSLGVTQKLPTGGAVSLDFVTRRSESLTRFAFGDTPFLNESLIWDTGLSLSVTHPLLKGVGLDVNLAPIRRARLAREASRWAAKAKAEAVIRDLWKTYLDVVAARESVRVQTEAVAQAKRDLDRARALIDAGRMAPTDRVDYEFALAQQRRAQLEAQTLWLQHSLAVRLALGTPVTPSAGLIGAELPANPFDGPVPTSREASRAALEHSHLMAAALEELKIKEIELVERSRDTWPKLDLSASVGPLGQAEGFSKAHEIMFKFKSIGWSVGLTFSYLIGDRAARAAREKARLSKDRYKVTVGDLRETLVSEATRTVALLRLERRMARTAELELRLARLRLENERKKYAAGRSTAFVVLQLKNEVIRADNKAFAARVAVLKRWADLSALMGTLLKRWSLEPKDIEALHAK